MGQPPQRLHLFDSYAILGSTRAKRAEPKKEDLRSWYSMRVDLYGRCDIRRPAIDTNEEINREGACYDWSFVSLAGTIAVSGLSISQALDATLGTQRDRQAACTIEGNSWLDEPCPSNGLDRDYPLQ
jgi:hypothetical protein